MADEKLTIHLQDDAPAHAVIPDDGWLNVNLRTADGQTLALRFDVVKVNNAFGLVTARHAREPERALAWCDWLTGQGYPAVSCTTGLRIADACIARVRELYGAAVDAAAAPAVDDCGAGLVKALAPAYGITCTQYSTPEGWKGQVVLDFATAADADAFRTAARPLIGRK